jgi:hypothetical protein
MEDEQYDPSTPENQADDHWTEHGDNLPADDDWFAIAAEITGAAR